MQNVKIILLLPLFVIMLENRLLHNIIRLIYFWKFSFFLSMAYLVYHLDPMEDLVTVEEGDL